MRESRVRIVAFALLGLASVYVGCGSLKPEEEVVSTEWKLPAFQPQSIGTHNISSSRRRHTDVVNSFVRETVQVVRYQVPGYRCSRADRLTWDGLPDQAEVPGEPGVFDLIYPLKTQGVTSPPLLFVPAGDALAFIEEYALEVSLAEIQLVETLKAEIKQELETENPGLSDDNVEAIINERVPLYLGSWLPQGNRDARYERTTQMSAIEAMERVQATAIIALAINRGFGVVVSGNCWGDTGAGMGDAVQGVYAARRFGGAFDDGVWRFARQLLHHDNREFAYACGYATKRIAQMLKRDRDAFDGIILDQPADDLAHLKGDTFARQRNVFSSYLQTAYTYYGTSFDPLITSYATSFFGGNSGLTNPSILSLLSALAPQPITVAVDKESAAIPQAFYADLVTALTDGGKYDSDSVRIEERAHLEDETLDHCITHERGDAIGALTFLDERAGENYGDAPDKKPEPTTSPTETTSGTEVSATTLLRPWRLD